MRKLSIILAILLLVACSKDEKNREPVITLTPDATSVVTSLGSIKTDGTDSKLTFTTNTSWTIEISESSTKAADWIDVSPKSGNAGDVTLNIKVDPNETPLERIAVLIIRYGTNTKEISIKQAQKDLLEGQDNNFAIDSKGGDFSFKLKYNINYSVNIVEGADWISSLETKAVEEKELKFTVKENHNDKRSGKIEIKGAGKTITMTINQDGYSISIKDEEFYKYLISMYDADKNGSLNYNEVMSVDTLLINTLKVKSLEGIDNFTNLKLIYCSGCEFYIDGNEKIVHKPGAIPLNCLLTSIDVSSNINLEQILTYGNKLTSLDLSKNSKIRGVYILEESLTSLDITKNINIDTLCFSYNKKISSINLSHLKELLYLSMPKTSLKSIDVSSAAKLQYISVQNSPVEQLDLSNNTNLTFIDLWETPTKELNVNNCKKLNELRIHKTSIEKLDLSKNVNLKILIIDEQPSLQELNIDPCINLTEIFISQAKIHNLDLSNKPDLSFLSLSETSLESLNINNLSALRSLVIKGSNLKSLDLTDLKNLKYLTITSTKISALDISELPNLINAHLNNNESLKTLKANNPLLNNIDLNNNDALFSVPLSGMKNLEIFRFEKTTIKEFDFTHNKKLKGVWLSNSSVTKIRGFQINGPLESINVSFCPYLEELWLPNNGSIGFGTETCGAGLTKFPILKYSEIIDLGPYVDPHYGFAYVYSHYPLVMYYDNLNYYLRNTIYNGSITTNKLSFDFQKVPNGELHSLTPTPKNIQNIKF